GTTSARKRLSAISSTTRAWKARLRWATWRAAATASGDAMENWQQAIAEARKDPRVAGAAPYIETQALLSGTRKQGALIRGVDPVEEGKVSVLAEKMVQGKLEDLTPGSFNIVLGRELAMWIGAGVGDKVLVLTDVRATPMGAVKQMKRFTVSGIFEAGYQEYDKGLAVVNLHDAQRLMRMGDGVTGVRLRMHDMDLAWEVARDLALRLKGPYLVSDWTRGNANMFRALKLEKTMMAILLSLIIAMGAFNLVSSQVMLVTDKQADIAILRTLGLTPGGVMQVFMVQGSLIGLIGTLSGVIGGIVLTLNLEHILGAIEKVFDVVLMPEDVYYVTGLPTLLKTSDVVTIALVALAMAFVATLYPAWRASRTAPAEALRYE
ncbi:MAG: FtsX-like permease family protein, partial [Luteimonas sp.]|nr:FtsX-like permease family protein [Luteimonas sp.]